MSIDLDTTTRPADVDGEERDRQAHYVKQDEILKSMWTGEPATALCGKKWVPNRDPKKYPVCKTCEKIFKSMPALP